MIREKFRWGSRVILAGALVAAMYAAGSILAFRFLHPDLTETQLFLARWLDCVTLALAAAAAAVSACRRRSI